MKVWDALVRLLHWTLVASVALAWVSTLGVIGGWHQPVGYIALAAVLLRGVWGFVGSRYARWRQFVRGPRATAAYARQVIQGDEPRYIGHNPLGAWMVLLLVACVLGLALTGWLYTTDRFWGDETVEQIHETLAWAMLGLISLHVAGVVFTSLRHKENLVHAMLTGRKPPAGKGDVA